MDNLRSPKHHKMKLIRDLISHFSHPNPNYNHNLKLGRSAVPFRCDGCKEAGIGDAYTCDNAACRFDLHTHLASLPTVTHPFYTECSFEFLRQPPGTEARYCNACEKRVTGFTYHCKHCGFDLHPCCAKLQMAIDGGDVKLYLYDHVTGACNRCRRKGRGWSYRCSCKTYNLHVACAKEILVDICPEIYGGGGGQITSSLKTTLETHVCHSKGKWKWKEKAQRYSDVVAMVLQIGRPPF